MQEGIAIKGLYASVALVFIGMSATIYKQIGGGSKPPLPDTYFICPQCGEQTVMTPEELQEKMREFTEQAMNTPGMDMIPPGQYIRHVCPHCNQGYLDPAIKCKKCDEVYLPYIAEGTYDDSCPKCGYSAMKERQEKARKLQNEKRKKKRDRKKKN